MDGSAPGLPVHHQLPDCSNSCPLSQWCHPTISSSVVIFSSCCRSFPASGSFTMSHFFTSGGQSIGVSTLASVLPMNTQEWRPLGWDSWISLQSKGCSRVFSWCGWLQAWGAQNEPRASSWTTRRTPKTMEMIKMTQEPAWRGSCWTIWETLIVKI